MKHGINTGSHPPLKERPRRFPPKEQEEIDRQIKQLLDTGMIEPSDSPWASNVVLVKKKDGTLRIIFDGRLVNWAFVDGPRVELATGESFARIEVPEGPPVVVPPQEHEQGSPLVVPAVAQARLVRSQKAVWPCLDHRQKNLN